MTMNKIKLFDADGVTVRGEIEAPEMHRTLSVREIDEKTRTVDLTFSSEFPVERFFGFEVLSHEPGDMDTSRILGGPLLVEHRRDDLIGVVETVAIRNNEGHARVRFGKGERAQEIFGDVVDGIRRSVSVGYRVKEMVLVEQSDGVETFRVTDWQPLEISLVSIPADPSVGVRDEAPLDLPLKDINTMDKETEAVDVQENERTVNINLQQRADETPAPKIDVNQIREEARKAEGARVADLIVLGQRHDQLDKAQEFIRDGKSTDEFTRFILDNLQEQHPVGGQRAEDANIGLTPKEKQDYRVTRLIYALGNPGDKRAQEAAAFEFECARAAADKAENYDAKGYMVPNDILRASGDDVSKRLMQRDLAATAADNGAAAVDEILMGGSFIDLLRNRMVLNTVGARTLADLTGNIAIPRHSVGTSAFWVGTEGGAITESTGEIDQVTLAPKTVGALEEYTKQFLRQASIDVEAFVRDDLATSLALAIDLAGLAGTGADGQPQGIKGTTGIHSAATTLTAFAVAVPTFAEVVDMESQVAIANADFGSTWYVIEPGMRGAFKTQLKFPDTGFTVWEPGGTVNGQPTAVSNQVTAGDVFYGNFNDLIMGLWGGLDLVVDPFTKAANTTVRVVAHQLVDFAVRHPESFAVNNDGV